MNTPTITMPTHVAREQLRHYRTQLHRRADAEYEAVAQGLEHLAKGTKLLNLVDCFKHVPLDDKHRPRLAFARADRPRVRMRRYFHRVEFTTRLNGNRRATGMLHSFEIPEAPGVTSVMQLMDGSSFVPMIPAQVRAQVGPIDLSKHFILWEADWTDVPHDPYLLKHCGGELYAILAEWDLTDLERAVMAGRR